MEQTTLSSPSWPAYTLGWKYDTTLNFGTTSSSSPLCSMSFIHLLEGPVIPACCQSLFPGMVQSRGHSVVCEMAKFIPLSRGIPCMQCFWFPHLPSCHWMVTFLGNLQTRPSGMGSVDSISKKDPYSLSLSLFPSSLWNVRTWCFVLGTLWLKRKISLYLCHLNLVRSLSLIMNQSTN